MAVKKKVAAKKAVPVKKTPVKKKVAASAKRKVSAPKNAVKAGKVPESEVDKERKAIEARGYKVERVCVTTHQRMPRRLKSEERPRAILCYMRPDGLFVRAVLGDYDIPPERRRPYGVLNRPEGRDMFFKIFDREAVKKWTGA